MKQRPIKYKTLMVSLVITVTGVSFFILMDDTITLSLCAQRLGIPLTRLMGFIFIGLLAGQAIEILGWTRQLAVVARPAFRFSRLGDHCGAAFTSAFISGATANAMLLDFYEEKKISRLKLFLSNYINQFPAYFLHLPTTVFIVLPLTGYAGALYFLLTFLAVLLRTTAFLVFGRVVLGLSQSKNEHSPAGPHKPAVDLFGTIQKRLPARIVNVAIWVLPIYTLVFIMSAYGVFDELNTRLAGFFTTSVLPVESLSVVILSFAAEFTSGFAAAGALLDAGVLTVKQTVLALLLGNILAFPVRALRHQLPRYMGIFSPKMGMQLLLSGQVFRMSSILIVGLIYYWVG